MYDNKKCEFVFLEPRVWQSALGRCVQYSEPKFDSRHGRPGATHLAFHRRPHHLRAAQVDDGQEGVVVTDEQFNLDCQKQPWIVLLKIVSFV